jgi:hypothetical protein
VLIALDRMERSGKDDNLSAQSAVQEVSQTYNMPVVSIGNLNDLFDYLSAAGADAQLTQHKDAVAPTASVTEQSESGVINTKNNQLSHNKKGCQTASFFTYVLNSDRHISVLANQLHGATLPEAQDLQRVSHLESAASQHSKAC